MSGLEYMDVMLGNYPEENYEVKGENSENETQGELVRT